MARSSARGRPWGGRSAASTPIIGRIRATPRWSPTWPRPGTSSGSRIAPAMSMTPSRPCPSCATSSTICAPGAGGTSPWSSAWTPPSSSAGFCGGWPPGTAGTRSRWGTGAGCRSRRSRRRAAAGTPWPPASPATRPSWSSPSGTIAGSAWSSTGSRSAHATRKNFQLDLLTPDDGHYEYSAVATNLPLGLPALWAFACGRGAQEKTFAELKGEFALDVVPTKHYAANSAWQQLSILAHNLIRSFQLDTLAEPKPRSRKRTYAYLFRSMRTLRFLVIARAGRLTRLGGRNVLRLTKNPATETLYGQIAHRLAA